MKIVAVLGDKGGVGKTTAAHCLCAALHSRGVRVALVDYDPSESALSWANMADSSGRPLPYPVHSPVSLGFMTAEERPDVLVIDGPGGAPKTTQALAAKADIILIPVMAGGIETHRLNVTRAVLQEAQGQLKEGVQIGLIFRGDRRSVVGRETLEYLDQQGDPVMAYMPRSNKYPESFGKLPSFVLIAPFLDLLTEVGLL